MQVKSIFIIIVLILALIVGFLFYQKQTNTLKGTIKAITIEYNQKIQTIQQNKLTQTQKYNEPSNNTIKVSNSKNSNNQDNKEQINDTILVNANNKIKNLSQQLASINEQLIDSLSNLKNTQQKLHMVNSKEKVLASEVAQIKNNRNKIKSLKAELKSAQQHSQQADKYIANIKKILQQQHKVAVEKYIARIKKLKEPSNGIAINGAHIVDEIKNYCADIKAIMQLEKTIFSKVLSLGANIQEQYQQQCTEQ